METLEQKRSDVVALNVAQMMEGEDKLGGVLYEYKSYRYSVEKHSMNSRPGFGFADGRYTGKFHESLKLQIEDEKKYTITATDAKTAKLIKLFGTQNNTDIVSLMKSIVPEYISNNSEFEKLDK